MEKHYNQIEDYIAGKLDSKSKAAFEAQLKADPKLADALQLQRSMGAFLKKENMMAQLMPELQALGDKHFQEKKATAKVVSFRKRLLMGAAIAASLLLFIFVWNNMEQQSPYEQFAVHDTLSLIEKGTYDPLAGEAQKAFNEQNYTKAVFSLKNFLLENPGSLKAQLAFGIASMETGDDARALETFTTLHEGTTTYTSAGTWYLALYYLKKDNINECQKYLKQIDKSADPYYYQKAQNLLKKL